VVLDAVNEVGEADDGTERAVFGCWNEWGARRVGEVPCAVWLE